MGNLEEETRKEASVAGKKKKYILLCAAVILALIVYGIYDYQLPEKRLGRKLKEADALMQEQQYQEAALVYQEGLDIDLTSTLAQEGYIRAIDSQADIIAQSSDMQSLSQACGLYELLIETADSFEKNGGGSEEEKSLRSSAAEKLISLRRQIAESFESVEYETTRQDQSGTVHLADESGSSFTYYYDLVQITQEDYPYAEEINAVLKQDMNAFFAAEVHDPSSAAAAGPAREQEDQGESIAYRDYVGTSGVYSGSGIFSVRLAEVRTHGSAQSNYYRGRTFRLSDAGEMTLDQVTGRTEEGLKRLLRRRLWTYLEREGYTNISKSDVEDYIEKTDSASFRFCVLDDGSVCLIVDQETPFFKSADEILQIPLDEKAGQ